MLAQEIIRRKRDGLALESAHIADFVRGLVDDSFSESQVSALAMAVFLKGMSKAETVALTVAMRDSGDVLDWSDLNGPVVDKHSTGGVGDNVSLMLAPIIAACGGFVPMISGRGLGHTGGTLDKMDAIAGYQTQPDNALFRRTVREAGCAIIGQTGNLAPADKRFYAIRDVTATVESIPLITASILSKKLAAGLGALVLDVKAGNGAFMANRRDAARLARSLVEVSVGAGLPATAVLTDMNEPLASAAGNAVEVKNAVDFLTGTARDPRLETVTLALAVEMLIMAGLATNRAEAKANVVRALATGQAAEMFARMVATLGGPADFIDRPDAYLASAAVVRPVLADDDAVVAAFDTRGIGIAVVELGGGRRSTADIIDPSVGLTGLLPIGTRVSKGDPIAMVHASSQAGYDKAAIGLRSAITLSQTSMAPSASVLRRITSPE